MGVFASLETTFDNATNSLVNSAIGSIVSTLTPVILVGVTVYFMITGYMIIAGRIQEPLSDLIIKAFKIAIVSALCLDVGGVTSYIIGGMNGILTMLNSAFGVSGSPFQALDDLFNKGIDSAANLAVALQELEFYEMGAIVTVGASMLVVMFGTILMTIIGGAIMLLSKVALTMIFAVSPFFIAGLFFPITARFADAWINQALNYILVSVFVLFTMSITNALFLQVANAIIAAVQADSAAFPALLTGEMLVLACINFFVLKQVPAIASGLAGGATSAGASLVGMAVGVKTAAQWATNPAAAAVNAINPMQSKFDPTTGGNVTARRATHHAMGRSMITNSNYRNMMLRRMQESRSGNYSSARAAGNANYGQGGKIGKK